MTAKAQGVDDGQGRTPGVPSGTRVYGLAKHLTAAELFAGLGLRGCRCRATRTAFRWNRQSVHEGCLRGRQTSRGPQPLVDGGDEDSCLMTG
ncbi:DinB family protein [Streptomyces monashensis]|uniref:DinB family protein n=1 Tax=Streptomyces monashensis TaxID=1678012 RepID=UPI001FE429DD|nr:DinB family protein [Streptomyces monashensis]